MRLLEWAVLEIMTLNKSISLVVWTALGSVAGAALGGIRRSAPRHTNNRGQTTQTTGDRPRFMLRV